jgi:DNA-binding transcriptional LysR family regulator
MRLDWIEDILAVADAGSFQRAAERRRLTQPAFSRRLRAIETALGAHLFDRSVKPATLAPHVREQVDRMRELAAGLRTLGETLRAGPKRMRGKLVIASQHAITTAHAPTLIEQLSPLDLDIRLRSANRDECLALLLTRQADIAVIYDVEGGAPLAGREFLELAATGEERLIPVFAAAQIQSLNAAFADGELPVIGYPEEVFLGGVQRALVFPQLARICVPRQRLETALSPAALQCALAGLGVAWIPASLAQPHVASGLLVDLSASIPFARMRRVVTRIAGGGGATDAAWRRIGSSLADPD